MLILAAFLPASAFSENQNISWTQEDLSSSLPCSWNTSGNIVVTATTDLDFSDLSVSLNGTNGLIESGDAAYKGTLTFTSGNGANYKFVNIKPRPGASVNVIIFGCNVSFSQTGNVEFIGDGVSMQGIDTRNTSLTFNDTGDILFSGFKYGSAGAAIYAWSEDNPDGVQFSYTGNVSFISNTTEQWGGAIVSNNVVFDQIKGDILFHDNHANGDAGGAIAAFNGAEGTVSFSHVTGSISFTENTAGLYQGGAIGTNKNVTFDHIQGGILFSDNYAVSDGGAIFAYLKNSSTETSFTNIGGGIEFSNNVSEKNGGAITTNKLIFSDVTGNILFADNRVVGNRSVGGAIYVENGMTIDQVHGDIAFLNNHAGYDGGAIYLAVGSESTIRAMGGNILFSGNTCEDNGLDVPNAISMTSDATLTLLAEEGRTIRFNDPITGGANTLINLNGDAHQATGGTIVFSSKHANEANLPQGETESDEDYQKRLSHSRNYYAQYITQYGGTVSLEDFAVMEANILNLTNDSLLKLGDNTKLLVTHLTREDSARLLISQGASVSLDVGDLDLTKGMDVNLSSFMAGNSSVCTFTLNNAASLSLGGLIRLVDESGSAYSGSAYFAQDRSIAIMNDASSARGETDFEGITQSQTKSYGYQGTWSFAWENDTLFAQWKASAQYEASPEQIGTSGVNSLWSSASNLQSFTDTSLEQATRQRLISEQKSNFWVSGLGDFSSQRTVNGINGYDYQGGGYVFGADRKVTDNTLVGFGFGQIFGTNQSRNYVSSIDQKSIMGMIYADKRMELSKTQALRFHLSAAYGVTDNKMSTTYAQGAVSHGKWDNTSYGVNARVFWDIALKNDWVVTPFVGLEYVRVNQDDFTENGDLARNIKDGQLGNLTLPIGVSLEKLSTLSNGMKWVNTGTLAYRADVYRENPEAQAALANDALGAKWTSKGSKLARSAVEAGILSRLHLNDKWNVYAGYNIEGRNNGLDQTGTIGIGLSF